MKKNFFVLFLLIFSSFFAFSLNAENASEKSIPDNYVSLLKKAETMNAKVYYDPLSNCVQLSKNGNTFSFCVDDEIAVLNYRNFQIIEKPVCLNNEIYVSNSLIDQANKLFSVPRNDENFKIAVILIDPGHGGKDPGTIGSVTKNGKKQNLYEKDIVLSVGNELSQMLKMKYPDKKIIMTRSTDVYLTLQERVEIANNIKLSENEAIIYISIHANSAFKKDAKGYEVWYLSPGYRRSVLTSSEEVDSELLPILNSMMEEEYTTESILMAKFIHDGMEKQIGSITKSRGLKAEEWFVVRNAYMPSVLIEVGFVSNDEEALNLASESYLHKISLGIYNGVGSFVTHFEQSRGFTNLQ